MWLIKEIREQQKASELAWEIAEGRAVSQKARKWFSEAKEEALDDYDHAIEMIRGLYARWRIEAEIALEHARQLEQEGGLEQEGDSYAGSALEALGEYDEDESAY